MTHTINRSVSHSAIHANSARRSSWAPSIRHMVQGLCVICILGVSIGGLNVFRALQDAALSDTVAQSFGPRMVQVIDSYTYDIPQTAPTPDLQWQLLTGNKFEQSTRRGWSETVLRISAPNHAETLVRISLADTGMDPNIAVQGADLAAQLTFLSRRIVAMKSAATLRVNLADNQWVEFSSPAHWQKRATHVQLTLAACVVLGALLVFVSVLSRRLGDRFDILTGFAQALLEQRPSDPLPVKGPAEARQLAVALNDIHSDFGRQIQDRTRFLAAISHDLRTPATRMKLRAELIEDEVLRGKMLADLDEIGDMVNAALSYLRDGLDETPPETILFDSLMQSLCDDYLDVGKPVTLRPPEPLVATAQGTLFDPRPSQFDVKFNRQITLTCQPSRLRRAFSNLIDNAINYGNWAEVEIQADAHFIKVRVIDGGPGIAPDQSKLVFEPFYRVENSRSRATGGSGLGLSVSKSIIEAHGGTIQLFNHDKHGLEVQAILPRTP